MTSFPDRSKFSPPQAPTVFYRQRLLTLFEKNRDKKLLLLVGQAGQGKSTLAAKAIESADRPVIWMNIDAADTDPASFLMNLTIAFQNQWETLDFRAVINNLGTFVSPKKAQTIYYLWAQTFWRIAPAEIRLVLDALETVPIKSRTHQLIEALVHTAPNTVQITLISRSRPPLKFERQKLDNRAMIIENETLAFDVTETAAFLRHTHQLVLKNDAANYVHAYTEGWAVGIIIIAQWLRQERKDRRTVDLEKRLSKTVPRDIYTYIAEEVFNALSSTDRQFLLQTAFLKSLDPDLIDTLLKTDNSAALLHRLARDYLFIQAFTDMSGKIFFRYHQVFKHFLRDTQKISISAASLRNLCLRAAKYYADSGLPESSLSYYIQAGEYPKAAQIIRDIGEELITRGQIARLAAHLSQFPKKERDQYAWLLLLHSATIRARKSVQALEQLCRCRDIFARDGDGAGSIMTLSYLIETSFLVGYSPVDMDQLLAEAHALLVTARQVPITLQAQLWLQIGFATIRGMGNFNETLTICQTAYLLAKEADEINMQCHSLVLSELACAHLGEFNQANVLNDQVKQLLPHCSTEIHTFYLSTQCVLNIFRGNLKEALTDLRQFETDVEKYGFHYFYTWLISVKCLLYPQIGKVIEAEQIILGWLHACPEPTFRRAMALLSMAYCDYYRAAAVKGAAALEEAAAIFNKGPLRSEFNYQAARKGLAMAAYLRKDYTVANAIFKEALIYANTINSHTLIAEAHLFMGLNKYAAKDPRGAAVHLQTGFEIVTTHRFTQLVIIHSDDLACACLLALKLQVLKDLSWVECLLVENANPAIVGELKELLAKTHNSEQKSSLKKVYDAIIQSGLPLVEITTLGQFKVILADSLIAESQWKGSGTRRFLSILLAHGGRNVPTDLIMEAMWPDSSPKAAHSNLKSALHRLRKVLNPYRERYTRSSYLAVRNTFVGLDQDLCRIDFERFEQTTQKTFNTRKKEDKIQLAHNAIDLYRGDFIPDELYESAIIRQRENLKTIYLKLLKFTTAIHLENDDLTPAIDHLKKWLAADPYSDTACRRLMRAYHKMNRPGQAIRLFSSFEARLQSDLQLTPDPETRVLFQEISQQL